MIYLLDTNACISYLNNCKSSVRFRLETLSPANVTICSIVESELYFGVIKSSRPKENMAKLDSFLRAIKSFSFDKIAAREFARIRLELFRRGTPIGPYDLQIAAIAIARNLTLVTHNIREFSRVPDLKFEDWESSQ